MKFYKNSYIKKLKQKGYAERTIKTYVKIVAEYEDFCNKNKHLNSKEVAYAYLQLLQKKQKKYIAIYRKLQPIKLYYTLHHRVNPFHYMEVKRVEKVELKHYLSKVELLEIYNTYPQLTVSDRRNKVLLGLFVFQGITNREIRFIRVGDIDLANYTIDLQGDERSNRRKLKLDIQQVLLLHTFITEDRKQIVKKGEQLITTRKAKNDLYSITRTMVKQLKQNNKKFKSFYHIRGSVISNWLKEYDLREVQYMAGHKRILSTERYVVNDITKLTKEVEKHFPIR